MKSKRRKAFTLVELLIVIAIIAVLSVVGLVGYSSFKKKAYISNDSALLEQLNLGLIADESINGKPKTMDKAIKLAAELGYKMEDWVPQTKGAILLYNQETNRFVLVDEEYNDLYETKAETPYNNWIIVDEKKELEIAQKELQYSVYLSHNYLDDSKTLVINENDDNSAIGVDLGHYSGYDKINVDLPKFEGEINIRTYNYDVLVKVAAPKATVNHYGFASVIVVDSINTASYHERGTVGRLTLKDGHASIDEGAEVFCLMNEVKEEDSTPKDDAITLNGGVVYEGTSNKQIANENVIACDKQEGKEHTFHKLVVDNEYVYDVCEECGYVVKYKVDKGLVSYDLTGEAKDGEVANKNASADDAAVGEVISYSTGNGETVVQGVSFFVGEGISIDKITDVDGNKISTYSNNDGVISITDLKSYEGLTIDYSAGKVVVNGEEVKVEYAGATVDKTTDEVKVEQKASSNTSRVVQEVSQEIKHKDDTSAFNFIYSTDTLPYGEEFKFLTNKSNVKWSVDNMDIAYIEDDGTLLACDFDTKVTVYAEYNGKTISHVVNLVLFHGGTGEKNDPYEIYNRYQFKYMWYGYQEYGYKLYYELVNDIDFENTDPHSYAYSGIHLEGNNHILSNGAGPLFSQMGWTYDLYLSNFTIKNFVSDYSLICNYGAYNISEKQVYDNIDVIDCTAKGGAFFLPWVYDNYDITFKNCDIKNSTVNNDVTCQGYVAGFVGNGKSTVTIDTCTMQANVVSSNPIVAGMIGSGDATVKNCSILPGTTITQKGSNTASAIGSSANISKTSCYATIIKSTDSGVNKNGFKTVVYLAQNLGFDADNFIIKDDGSVDYTGSVEIAKLGIYQTVTTNRLHDGEFENGGFPTSIRDTMIFEEISAGTIDNALNYISAVKNVTNKVSNKLYCSIEKLPSGLEFNSHGFVYDNGTLYLDANQHDGEFTSNYFAGTLRNKEYVTKITVTVYFEAYDASGSLLGTFTKDYSVMLDK